MRHESNVAYLRRSISTISSSPVAPSDIPANPDVHYQSSGNNCFDMLSAGGVMTAPVFNSLLLQSILNPNIITLWEKMLGGRAYGTNDTYQPRLSCTLNKKRSQNQTNTNVRRSNEHSAGRNFFLSVPSSSSSSVCSGNGSSSHNHDSSSDDNTRRSTDGGIPMKVHERCCHFTKLKKNQTMAQAKCSPHLKRRKHTPMDTKGTHSIPSYDDDDSGEIPADESPIHIPILGRIACPALYTGLTYGLLFEDLLERSGLVCIGVHRLTMQGGNGSTKNRNEDNSSQQQGVGNRSLHEHRDTQHLQQQQQYQQQIKHDQHKNNRRSLSPQSGSDTALASDSDRKGGVILDSHSDSDFDLEDHNSEDSCAESDKAPDDVSVPYVFISPSNDFLLDENDYIFVLRCSYS